MALEQAINNAAQIALLKNNLKKGKTEEQKQAIDYLFGENESQGCGCLSQLTTITNQQYMAIVQRKCEEFDTRARALEKIGLDPSQVQEIPPIVLSSFVYDDDCHVRVDNGVAVSSQYSITWIFFSATQMYTYKYVFDTTSSDTWEITNDFFYGDITCFTTGHSVKEKIRVTAAKGCLGTETVNKSRYVVDTLEVIVPGTKYIVSLTNSPTVEQSIQAAKAMLREKKYSK